MSLKGDKIISDREEQSKAKGGESEAFMAQEIKPNIRPKIENPINSRVEAEKTKKGIARVREVINSVGVIEQGAGIPLEMYSVPGQDEVSAHSFDRYKKDKEQDQEIEKLRFLDQQFQEENLDNLKGKDLSEFILKILKLEEYPNISPHIIALAKKNAISQIGKVQEKDRQEILEKALDDSDIEVQKVAASRIDQISSSKIKSKLREKVSGIIRGAKLSEDVESQSSAIGMIKNASQEQIPLLIAEFLDSENVKLRSEAVLEINQLPEKDRGPLVMKALKDVDPNVQAIGASFINYDKKLSLTEKAVTAVRGLLGYKPEGKNPLGADLVVENAKNELAKNGCNINVLMMIKYAPKESQPALRKIVFEKIKEGLLNKDIEVQRQAAMMVDGASEEDKKVLKEIVAQKIREGLSETDIEIQRKAIKMLYEVSPEDRIALEKIIGEKVSNGLDSEDEKIRKGAMEMVHYVGKNELPILVMKAAKSKDILIKRAVAGFIGPYGLSDQDRAVIIRELVDEEDVEIRKNIIENLRYLSKEELKKTEDSVVEKIRAGIISDKDGEFKKVVAENLRYLSVEGQEKIEGTIIEKIRAGLGSENSEDRKKAVYDIDRLSPEKGYLVAMEILDGSDVEAKKIAVQMIDFPHISLSIPERNALFDRIVKVGLGKELIESPLYKKTNITKGKFSTEKFLKTGETLLIGGSLKDKAIIRRIDPEAFLTWQKLFEDYKLWKENGFDYVPIEQIISYKQKEDRMIDVFSGVLDLSYGKWISITTKFGKELAKEREKIMQVLEKSGVKHGHPHKNNFCLRFYRDEKGNPDFNRIPRLYLIDLDQAVSTAEKGQPG